MMFQRIVVPLDGSLLAERALPLAAQIARASQGIVILLHIGSFVGEQSSGTPPQSSFGQTLLQTRMKRSQEYLTALLSSPIFSGVSLSTAVLSGPVVATTQAALRTYQADLLVLCEQIDPQEQTSGVGNLARQVLKDKHTPVLLVPEHGPSLLASHANHERPITVLVAFDRPQPSPALIESATSLLAALDEKGQGQLCFVPLSTAGLRAEAPVHRKQVTVPPASLVGSETSHASVSAALLKDRLKGVSWGGADQRDDGDALVLGIPGESSAWILAESQRHFLAGRNAPVLLVPLCERG